MIKYYLSILNHMLSNHFYTRPLIIDFYDDVKHVRIYVLLIAV